jgi:hypothetical protein
MTPRRLIELAPMPIEERLVLRLYRRPNHPDVHGADDVLSWWWTTPLVVESPAPAPARAYGHVARVLAESAWRDLAGIGRN